jgi:hypothetical protein
MKKSIIIITLFAALTASLSSCYYEMGGVRGYGPVVETTVNLDFVTGIEIDGSMDVEIIPSEEFMVVIIAQQNIADVMVIDVVDDVARLSYKPHLNVNPTDVAKVIFYMPELYSLRIDGSGDIYVYDYYETEYNFDLKINGSGDIIIDELICGRFTSEINGSGDVEANIVASKVETVIRGSGDIKYRGSTTNHEIRISGSGDIEAFDLHTDTTKIDISGSGNCYVWAENILDIFISGSGSVTYKGTPQLYVDLPGSGGVNAWK